LTNQPRARRRIDLRSLYRVLRSTNPSPYAAFLRFPGVAILSPPPERFLTATPSGLAEGRPINGPRPRGPDPASGQRLATDPRGVYSGALGYFSSTGAIDLGMTIRTIVMRGEEMSFGVGGAIVADSDPDAEYEETVVKARALLRAVAIAHAGEWREEDLEL